MSEEPTAILLSPVRALLLLGVVIALFAIGETEIGFLATALWLCLVVIYGRRR